jgi:hypothetical protein
LPSACATVASCEQLVSSIGRDRRSGRGSRAARSSTISTLRRRDLRCASSGFAFIAPSFVLVLGLAAHVAVGLAPVS